MGEKQAFGRFFGLFSRKEWNISRCASKSKKVCPEIKAKRSDVGGVHLLFALLCECVCVLCTCVCTLIYILCDVSAIVHRV